MDAYIEEFDYYTIWLRVMDDDIELVTKLIIGWITQIQKEKQPINSTLVRSNNIKGNNYDRIQNQSVEAYI